MGIMESFRIITEAGQLTELPVSTIICPPRQPNLARRRAWTDEWAAFESTRIFSDAETWDSMTSWCPAGDKEVWVLWDAAASKPAVTKAWQTVIPDRRPERKNHTGLGPSKNSVTGRIYDTAAQHMQILELDPDTGDFVLLYDVPVGTRISQLPWKQ